MNPGLAKSAGPELLREPLASAPQLTNAGIWHAAPILISGATAYRDGEFLYQGFLFDDHGADGGPGAVLAPLAGESAFSSPMGTYSYPTGPGYDANAANLVELRLKPVSGAVAFRVTLNTLVNPNLVAFTLALGKPGSPNVGYPDGAGVTGPADVFVTVYGDGEEHAVVQRSIPNPAPNIHSGLYRRSAGHLIGAGATEAGVASVSLDFTRHQFTVVVPSALWNPGNNMATVACGVGLWDASAGTYLHPAKVATSTQPGGAGDLAQPEAFFDVAFRTSEPGNASTLGGDAWRDHDQAVDLAVGNMTPFTSGVDFAKLNRHVEDDSNVPTSGPMDRIMASHFSPEPGVDQSGDTTHRCDGFVARCEGELEGNLQPYALYVPAESRTPSQGWGLTLLLHGSGANYNEFFGTLQQQQYAERGGGSLVLTPEARGPQGFYDGLPEADVFEAWADVAAHYRLDPGFTDISGYSMGGVGAFVLATQFPDLFARVQPVVGTGAVVLDHLFASLRNDPVLMWNAQDDALVTSPIYQFDAQTLGKLGYRFEQDVFAGANHLTLAANDQFAPAAAFLGTAVVDPDPAHVTYVSDPTYDDPSAGIVADHAYWVSGVKLRSTAPHAGLGGEATATVDARSGWFGQGDPEPSGVLNGSGVLVGGRLGPLDYTSQYQTWGPVPHVARADVLTLDLVNVSSVTIDLARAHVDCSATLRVTSDGPSTITLSRCASSVSVMAGTSTVRATNRP